MVRVKLEGSDIWEGCLDRKQFEKNKINSLWEKGVIAGEDIQDGSL